MTPLPRPNKRTAVVAIAATIGLAVTGGGAYAFFASGDDTEVVAASDIVQVAQRDIEEKVHASGDVGAHRSTSITSRLTGPVKEVKVKLGDHVQAEQLLALMDTTSLQRQLELEQANLAATDTTNRNALQAEQKQYEQLRTQYEQGANPEVAAADAAERQARSALEEATRTFENKRRDFAIGSDPTLREQHLALQAARDEQRDAALNLGRVNAANLYGIVVNDITSPDGIFDAVDTQNRLDRADRDLAEKQRDYEHTLVQVDRELAELQTKVRDAEAAYSEAAVSAEAARLLALHNIDKQRTAVESAQATVATGSAASVLTSEHLSVDISQAEIRSPHGGIITELSAQPGAPSEGVLMTVADDSRFLLKTKIKEADLAKVKPGTEVTFTTPSNKERKYKGKVAHVAAVAHTAGADPAKTKREFPVEIAVDGDTEGLSIGGTAKIEFLVNKQVGALTVPREAVLKTDDELSIIVLREEGEKYRMVKVPVTVTAQNEFDAAIESLDINAGDRVATDPMRFTDGVDKLVRIGDR